MFFPESLFVLSQRDLQVTWLDPFLRRAITSQAAATVTADIAVPSDRALVLQAACIESLAGAAQSLSIMRLRLLDVVGNFVTDLAGFDAASVVAGTEFLNWSGSILLPPGWTISGQGTFSGGAAANAVETKISGILIPAANIQRV